MELREAATEVVKAKEEGGDLLGCVDTLAIVLEEAPAASGRHASAQAWRRLRKAIGPGEVRGIAKDLASVAGGDVAELEYALSALPWDQRNQL